MLQSQILLEESCQTYNCGHDSILASQYLSTISPIYLFFSMSIASAIDFESSGALDLERVHCCNERLRRPKPYKLQMLRNAIQLTGITH